MCLEYDPCVYFEIRPCGLEYNRPYFAIRPCVFRNTSTTVPRFSRARDSHGHRNFRKSIPGPIPPNARRRVDVDAGGWTLRRVVGHSPHRLRRIIASGPAAVVDDRCSMRSCVSLLLCVYVVAALPKEKSSSQSPEPEGTGI